MLEYLKISEMPDKKWNTFINFLHEQVNSPIVMTMIWLTKNLQAETPLTLL
jgi:hypothetical protein